MSNVASLELCMELYALTADEWLDQTSWQYAKKGPEAQVELVPTEKGRSWPKGYWTSFPAYDLGYLLRKLPKEIQPELEYYRIHITPSNGSTNGWEAGYGRVNGIRRQSLTPEDAACKLAIELFKQGVLSHE